MPRRPGEPGEPGEPGFPRSAPRRRRPRARLAAGLGRARPAASAPRGPGSAPPPLAGAARGPGEQRPRPQRKVRGCCPWRGRGDAGRPGQLRGQDRGLPRAMHGAPASSRVQLLSSELSPASLGPGLAGFPLTALRLRHPARPGRLLSQPLPPRLASPTASSWLGLLGLAWLDVPTSHPVPDSRPCVCSRGLLALAWAWAHTGAICPFMRFNQPRLARFPLYFFLFTFVLSEGWRVTGLAGAVSPRASGQRRCRAHALPPGALCRIPGPSGRIVPPELGCPSWAQTHKAGHGFLGEAVRLPSRAGSCVGGELMPACLSVCAWPGGRQARGPRLRSPGGLRSPTRGASSGWRCWVRSRNHGLYCKGLPRCGQVTPFLLLYFLSLKLKPKAQCSLKREQ